MTEDERNTFKATLALLFDAAGVRDNFEGRAQVATVIAELLPEQALALAMEIYEQSGYFIVDAASVDSVRDTLRGYDEVLTASDKTVAAALLAEVRSFDADHYHSNDIENEVIDSFRREGLIIDEAAATEEQAQS